MELEAQLAELRASVRDARAGLFGPGSKLWEVSRHSVLFLGAGRAALLQLAHPWVAQAIADHSRTRRDPMGRFQRTFLRVFAMVYGDLEAAFGAARAVHRVHAGIAGTLAADAGAFACGTRYRADDPDALLWVHATLWETSILVYERVVRPLDAAEKDAYYDETRRFAALFGIPRAVLPRDWAAFERYNADMWQSDRLHVTREAARMAAFVLAPPHPVLKPLSAWYRRLTAGLLPERIRAGFGLPFEAADRRLLAGSLGFARRSQRLWPRHLRYVPPYLEAQRRATGARKPDRLGALLQRALVGEER